MEQWLGVIGVVIGAVIGAGIQELRFRREERERYRVMTFQSRLEVHQAAYSLCYELNIAMNGNIPSKIGKTVIKARDWWHRNCLFLEEGTRKKMSSLLLQAGIYATGTFPADKDELAKMVWKELKETYDAIVKGIGADYLPEMMSPPEGGRR